MQVAGVSFGQAPSLLFLTRASASAMRYSSTGGVGEACSPDTSMRQRTSLDIRSGRRRQRCLRALVVAGFENLFNRSPVTPNLAIGRRLRPLSLAR